MNHHLFRAVILFALLNVTGMLAQAAWINEFHYDNVGGDVDEAVEIVLGPTEQIVDFTIELYNGSNGTRYSNIASAAFTPGETNNGYQIHTALITGIQNGAPDGIALVDSGSVVEFLSYEGVVTATNQTANGLTSIDVGVMETGSTPIGSSIQRIGTGTEASDFAWTGPSAHSRDSFNVGQSVSAVPEPSSIALLIGIGVFGAYRRRRRSV